ncbi:SusD/RagB family nutrient-binding outer membrane lipoprotein [Labilibacter sediminis]|nr:SusD/RagB family nutrient-binding outer membrane lipoprotein [Labilibacter sediminis]
MKNKILAVALSLMVVFTWGCDDYLDVNQDPNVLSDIPDPVVLLPAAQVGLGNQLMGWDFGFGGAYWVEYWTQSYTASQFKTLCEYQETEFDDAYQDLTAGVLNDLKRIKTLSGDNDNKAPYYVAEVLSIFTWQVMTDVWGDIPYSEALKGDEGIDSPKFDEGEDIYTDLLARINALTEIDLSEGYLEEKYDFYYAGNLEHWKKFANSVKLKLMLRLSETSGYNNADVLNFIENNDLLEKHARIKGSVWEEKEGKRHPMLEFEEGGAGYRSTNVIACKTFLDYLESLGDPRTDKLFEAPDSGHKGAFFGDFDSKADSDGNGTADDDEEYSESLFINETSLVVMSTFEVDFYIAEVYARAMDNANAKKYYDRAVASSLKLHGYSDAEIASFDYTGDDGAAKWVDIATPEEGIKQVAMQKWVAYANYQHIEAFLERNRTKYPPVDDVDVKADRTGVWDNFPVGYLTVSVNGRTKTNAKLPSSPIYPQEVLTRNINAPGQKTDLLEKVWWDKKVGK